MAKMSIQEIEKAAADHYRQIEDIDRKISDRQKSIRELRNKAREAAENGDAASYKAISSEVSDIETEVYCLNAQRKKMESDPAVPMETIEDAWGSFLSEYERDLRKITDRFEKRRNEMIEAFGEMLAIRENILDIHARLSKCCGAELGRKASSLPLVTYANSGPVGLLTMGGVSLRDPDAVYYLSNYARRNNIPQIELVQNAEVQRVTKILTAE